MLSSSAYLMLFSLADDADKGETSVSSCHERCGTLAVSLDVRQIERLLLDEASGNEVIACFKLAVF
jgi:hypothetical protein